MARSRRFPERERALARIEKQRRPGRVLQPETPEFISTPAVVKLLCIAKGTLYSMVARDQTGAIDKKSRSLLPGKSGKGVGYLWSRADAERVNAIRRAASIRFVDACRVAEAIKAGKIPL